jgi:hypothetical protein
LKQQHTKVAARKAESSQAAMRIKLEAQGVASRAWFAMRRKS